jgi:hypothetical protein
MPINLNERLKAAAELVSSQSILEFLELIWSNDRFFTFPAYQKTAKLVAERMRAFEIKTDTCELPADGKTVFGDWRMPLGWDCTKAVLEIVEPAGNRVIADLEKFRTHIVMWSGPTPPEGLTAEAVFAADETELEAALPALRGKILVTPLNPRTFKKRAADAGAAAIVTSYCRNAEVIPDAVFWFNGWSDSPDGWAFNAGDTPLPAMGISPNTGRELQELARRGPVTLKMTVHSRYYETTLPIVHGVVPGASQEEVLAIGHAMEQGVNDNATGAAVILETLRVIDAGVKAGKLAPLKRGVRGILTNECYGTVGFAAKNPKLMKRTLAGVNFDTLGRHRDDTGAKFRHHRCPDASASVADTLMALLLDEWLPRKLPHLHLRRDLPFALTDNAYCDPQIGVHCTYVDSQDHFWHTSADTMEKIDPPTLHAFAAISVAYLHFLATAGTEEALWLARMTVARYGRNLQDTAADCAAEIASFAGGTPAVRTAAVSAAQDKPAALARALDQIDYLREIGELAIASALRFVPKEERAAARSAIQKERRHLKRLCELEKRRMKELAGCEPGAAVLFAAQNTIEDIAEKKPLKKFIGTPAYDTIPLAERTEGGQVWSAHLHCALFWCDGTLPVREILRRVSYEFPGRDHSEYIAKHLRFMAKHGLIEW